MTQLQTKEIIQIIEELEHQKDVRTVSSSKQARLADLSKDIVEIFIKEVIILC